MKLKLIGRTFKYYMLASIISLCLGGLYLFFFLESLITFQTANTLETQAKLAVIELEAMELTTENQEYLQNFAQKTSIISQCRVSIIDGNGLSLGESAWPQDPLSRPEIISALESQVTVALSVGRFKQKVLSVAVPVIGDDGSIKGIIAFAKNFNFFYAKHNFITIQFYVFIAVLLVSLVLISCFFSHQYAKPLKYIYSRVCKFAANDFDSLIDTAKTAEFSSLAENFNCMVKTIQKRVNIIVSQSNNLNAIFNSMTDAVIAVDADENIIDVNPAALKWLELPRTEVEGHPVNAVIRHKALKNFIHEAINNHTPKDANITLSLDNAHVLNVKSSPIYDANNNANGCIIVFYDVTRIRHLENLRSDFVSNVSHEIRTPLTVIKGSTEILRESLKDNQESARFLEIINKHTNRLTALVNDLLLLSRIEQNASELIREKHSLLSIINKALNAVEPKIKEKGVIIILDCPPELNIKVDNGLMEQALINLIDNAVKYSEPNNPVRITASADQYYCRISVKDRGQGIDSKHFERLFERFYRIDEARSRKLGGAGLGLAIVKHIARAHNGVVEIISEPGAGAIFTIVIPLD